MGDALKIFVVFNCSLDFSDCIEIFGIIVNFFLAIWIVRTIQNKLNNKRVLKDHFISEIKELRIEYNDYIKNCYAGNLIPQDTLRWFKLINIKTIHLMGEISNLYKVNCPELNSFHNDLRDIITNAPEYSTNFRRNNPVAFSSITKRQIDLIQLTHYGLFNKLIRLVNDAD
ncbi:hypothetical protein SAMN05443549_103432 [Flavobacterium fluvii]|uniref:Uncharacterized protein n=1 Tax=Flavobacterium fluvii TaxID=468056 RepID=A0A1M5JAF1_9FLAO|nr:hypothetical protein [Flavobacterium fluvii]SHG37471.1 hypothetical protein SAMN05443549_103432 [Flavobacterium fluvii]